MNACVPDARTLAAVCFLVTGSLSASAAAAACASASPNALARTKSSAASARSAPAADPAAAWLVPGRAPPFASASASISVTHAAAPPVPPRAHSDRRRVSAAAANVGSRRTLREGSDGEWADAESFRFDQPRF